MKIGYCGLGKLGFPVALATEAAGHDVFGYDPHVDIKSFLREKKIPYQEKGVPELLRARVLSPDVNDGLARSTGSFTVVDNPFELVKHSDLIFVPVQTPHDPHYEGTEPPPDEVKDFNYEYLKAAMADLAKAAAWQQKTTTVVIISTVLPGTVEREIKPLLNDYVHLAYNPYFIAMGTTVDDYLNPEFVLLGCDSGPQIINQVEHFYSTIHDRPVFTTNIETAELIKVAYNTFISMKIVFANTMMEICQKTNADVDELTEALSMATDRVISPKYLKGGMGDGGGCHPRDNIAMSYLAKKLNLSYDIFKTVTEARDYQARWLARLVREKRSEYASGWADVTLLGEAYKPETNLTVGSPAKLVSYWLNVMMVPHRLYDPHVSGTSDSRLPGIGKTNTQIYLVTTNHKAWAEQTFPQGSVVIDPWGYIQDQEGVEVIRLGRKN